ncbi:YybH family protein [Aquiflexum lacus]|uniref:YybH family protein n=1 Tax=Aquiflexum lacus TaxID=2483805 RepID=UPI0021D3B9A1|nr:nuclear transport factor 2 family protein [Aquiflexum lacus]
MKVYCTILFFIFAHLSFSKSDIDSLNTIEQEILSVNRAMEAEFDKGNYSKIGEFYADKAAMVGNKVEVIGKDNLVDYWGKFKNAHSWKLENIEITVLGPNVALQRGYSNISYYNANVLQTARSIFSLVWIKTEEGWKMMLDHFSPR